MKLKEMLFNFNNKDERFILILSITIWAHLILFLLVQVNIGERQKRKDNKIHKMTEVTEYVPPDANVVEIARQDDIAENIIETNKEIRELDIDYLPFTKVSKLPQLPEELIRSRMVYPPLAKKQGIEGYVVLGLYIDATGKIRKVQVLKTEGYSGFGEAAVNALNGVVCKPAEIEGIPTAVYYRFNLRFILR